MAKKIAIGFGVFVLIALLLLLVTPVLFKTQLNRWVKNEINANLKGNVNYADVDIIWVKHFPDIDFTLNKLTITGDSIFKGDTVISIEHMEMTIAWSSLWSNAGYRVMRANLIRPRLHLKIDSTGAENWHLLKAFNVTPGEGVVNAKDSKQLSWELGNYTMADAQFDFSDLKRHNQLFARGVKLGGSLRLDSLVSAFYTDISIGDLYFYNATIPEKRLRLTATLRYDPRADTLLLDSLNAQSGKSDIQGSARFENLSGLWQDVSSVVGKLDVHSRFFDIGEWLDTTGKQRPPPAKAIAGMPAVSVSNIAPPPPAMRWQIAVNARFDTLKFNKLMMEQAGSEMCLSDDSLVLLSFNCSMLGGTANATGKIENKHDVEFQLSVHRCQAQQTFVSVPMADKISPVARYITGDFSSVLKGKGKLSKGLNLDYNTFEGSAKIEITHAKISQIPALSNIAKLAKIPNLENLEVNKTTSSIRCKAGTVTIEPTDIKFTNGIGLNIKGTNTFTNLINYDIRLDMPTQQMGNIATLAQNILSGIPGLNVQIPKAMSFYFNVNGSFDNPQTRLIRVATGGQ